MEIYFHTTFKKQFKKIPPKIQDKFSERLELWLKDSTDPVLRVHLLKGMYANYWSMSVTGDIRALYKYEGEELVIFALIGTHSSLYGK
jgi:addiction module RelE/StbE family toxin